MTSAPPFLESEASCGTLQPATTIPSEGVRGHSAGIMGNRDMQAISKEAASEFCKVCNWAYETWVTPKCLFDEYRAQENNMKKADHFMSRLSVITQEYCLLQIAKLHDPAVQNKFVNLTIDCMIMFGNWGAEEEKSIKQMQKKLSELFKYTGF